MATHTICCKQDPNFFLTIRANEVVFAPANKNDENQQWYKYKSTGSSSFAVVHKVTGQAIKCPNSDGNDVELVSYNSSNKNDPYLLWNENDDKDDKDGYKTIATSVLGRSWPYWRSLSSAVKDGGRVNMHTIMENRVLNLWKMMPVVTPPNNDEPKDVQIVTPTLPPIATLVRIHSKLESSLFLSIQDHKVVLETSYPSDEYQQWYVYMTNDGSSSFAVVNKATRQAIKQALGSGQLGLIPYSETADVSLLWAEYETEDEEGYICIKMATNNQVWDVENNIAENGNPICCFESTKQSNQLWMMTPCAQLPPIAPLVRLYCKAGPNFSLSMRDGKVVLASPHPYDKLQQWYKVDASNHINDDNGYACYVYVNKRTGNAIKWSSDSSSLSYAPFQNTNDKTLAWTERSLDNGYKMIRSASKSKWFFNTDSGEAKNGVVVQNYNHWSEGNGQQWKIAPCVPIQFNRPLVRVFCKDQPDLCITVTKRKVVVGPADFRDKFQLWYKADASEQVNDDDCNFQWPCFALVNDATGMAVQHSSSGKAVKLTRYVSSTDTSILWFEYSLKDGSKTMRPVTKSLWALESLSDSANYDVTLGCFSCDAKSNQKWFISPADAAQPWQLLGSSFKSRIYTKIGSDYVITIRDNKVVLALFNPDDSLQAWYKEIASKDENGSPAFILINKNTGLVIKYPTGAGQQLELVSYDPDVFDKSILWSEWSLSDGYVAIGLMNDYSGMTWDAKGGASDGVVIGCNYYWEGNNGQRWRVAQY